MVLQRRLETRVGPSRLHDSNQDLILIIQGRTAKALSKTLLKSYK